jgi:ketosteroid isomerase-like protein
MNIDRRNLALPILFAGLMAVLPSDSQASTADEAAVQKRVEALRDAQRAKDAKALTALTAKELSYSHSDARVEDRDTFVTNATSTKSKVISIENKDIWVKVVGGTTALVRFHWMSESEVVADGKRSTANLHVLQVWQKQNGAWNLLARGSTKLA